jgi:MYXO-CTERM domain-containing protein
MTTLWTKRLVWAAALLTMTLLTATLGRSAIAAADAPANPWVIRSLIAALTLAGLATLALRRWRQRI